MSFAQLLQNLGSYLDFSKRLATTVPGLVMAFAIVLLTGSVPDWVSRIYTCGEYRWSQRATLTLDRNLESTSEPDVRLVRTTVIARRREYAAALQELAACPVRCDSAVSAAKTARTNLSAACDPVAADPKEKIYCAALVDFPASASSPSGPEKELLAVNDDFGRAAAASQCRTSPPWPDIANGLLLFGVIGFAFGVVLDPVSKALFLESLPEMSNPVARAFVGARRPGLDLNGRSAQWAIGRGLITDAEYQGLIDAYFRFSEVTIGLVLPVVAIGAALVARSWAIGAFVRMVLYGVATPIAAMILARIGTRRHAEFEAKVGDLIAGRIDRMQNQQRQERERVDLAALQTLVHQAAALIAKPHSK